jgi:hypothetical protein
MSIYLGLTDAPCGASVVCPGAGLGVFSERQARSEPQAFQRKRKPKPPILWIGFGALNVILSVFFKSLTRSVENIHPAVHMFSYGRRMPRIGGILTRRHLHWLFNFEHLGSKP